MKAPDNKAIRMQLGWPLLVAEREQTQRQTVLAGFEATNGKRPVKPERPAVPAERLESE